MMASNLQAEKHASEDTDRMSDEIPSELFSIHDKPRDITQITAQLVGSGAKNLVHDTPNQLMLQREAQSHQLGSSLRMFAEGSQSMSSTGNPSALSMMLPAQYQ